MGEEAVVLWIDDDDELEMRSSRLHCRICHEEDLESSKRLEAPCACSGTVKFAHRDCIQRWCDEKGNITCEICLQRYKPGYTTTSKKAKLLDSMTVGESSEVEREEGDTDEEEPVVSDCTNAAADRNASFCRSLAFLLTFLLLSRDLYATCSGGHGNYPFTLLTVLVFRASGIVLPMYIVIQTISAIRKNIRGYNENSSLVNEESAAGGNREEQLHLV